jgi:hypothetical protein
MSIGFIWILWILLIIIGYVRVSSNFLLRENEGYINYNKTKHNTILLLGDSMLNNSYYTSNGKGVYEIIKEQYDKVLCNATDNAKIIDVYLQIDKLSSNNINKDTIIFLSIGGNDLLFQYDIQQEQISNLNIIKPIFAAYKTLLKSIQTKYPSTRLILLDIYYPSAIKFQPFHSIITEWNKLLYSLSNNVEVLKISTILTQPTDFSFGIEPSYTGSIKIADNILSI